VTTEPRIVRSAVVLAGGRSRRFGPADKALARIAGQPMVRRVVDALAVAADEVIVNCRPRQRPRIAAALDGDVRFAVDPPDRVDGGPVAGLQTGLAAARGPLVAVAACDMPRLSPALLDLLFVRATGGTGAAPDCGTGPRPLPVVYRRAPALAACETVGRGGSLRAVLDRLAPARVPPEAVRGHAAPGALADVNAPADLRNAASDVDP